MHSLWMIVAAALFAVMGACVKLAAADYSTAEIVFYRGLTGAVILLVYARLRGLELATPVAAMHVRRGAVGVVALALWFYAIGALPMGTAMTLNYTSPLVVAAFAVGAAARARQRIDWRLAAAVVGGFVGVVLVLQPSFRAGQTLAALAGAASGFISALAYWHVKALGRAGEPEWRTVFYFSLSGAALGLAGAAVTGLTLAHSARGAALLGAVGVTATLAQLAMTRAYGRGATLLTAALQFSAVVFAAALGAALFGDRLGVGAAAGMALIVASGIAATVLAARRRPAPSRRVVDAKP